MGEEDCTGEHDTRRTCIGGTWRLGEGDLCHIAADLCLQGEGDLHRLAGGDLRQCIGEGNPYRQIGEGYLCLLAGEEEGVLHR